jgi:hypothetical protein
MRSKYRLIHDEPHAIGMMWSYDDGRTQKIVVRQYQSDGREMVEFKSPFARQGEVDPLNLLRENSRLPFGAVALSGDVFIVVHNALLDNMPLPDFEFLVDRIAAAADHLERQHADGDTF